jgi:hypothetical protein
LLKCGECQVCFINFHKKLSIFVAEFSFAGIVDRSGTTQLNANPHFRVGPQKTRATERGGAASQTQTRSKKLARSEGEVFLWLFSEKRFEM